MTGEKYLDVHGAERALAWVALRKFRGLAARTRTCSTSTRPAAYVMTL